MTPESTRALLKSRRTEDRIRAVRDLKAHPGPESQALLLQALKDRSNYVAALAAEALSKTADDEAAPAMVERFEHLSEDGLKRDPGCHTRSHLAFAFGRLEYGPAVAALRIGIRTVQIEAVGGVPFDTAAHLRANCALALAQLRAPGALRDIALLLFDRSVAFTTEPQKVAAQALARLADPAALIPLSIKLTFSEGEAPEVLAECMEAVVQLEDPRALELLEPYLHDPDQALAAHAALMIAQTHAPEAPALLRQTVRRLSGNPLKATVLALTILRSDEAFAVLRDLAEEEREEVRLAVVEALAGAPNEGSDGLLRSLAETDPSVRVRGAAKRFSQVQDPSVLCEG